MERYLGEHKDANTSNSREASNSQELTYPRIIVPFLKNIAACVTMSEELSGITLMQEYPYKDM